MISVKDTYLLLFFIFAFVIIAAGVDNTNAITICLSCLSNVGPTLGTEIGPTMSWAELPAFIKWFCSFMMLEFGRWDAKRGWVKQLHLGALRNNNTRLLTALGPDTGFDSIGDFPQTVALSRYLNTLDSSNELPRTVLYNLNPADNYAFATMIGNFQDGTVPGKIQYGSGWWFLDQKEAMEWQLGALSNLGLLGRFVVVGLRQLDLDRIDVNDRGLVESDGNQLRERDKQAHHDDLDADKGDGAPVDFAGLD